jgi:Sec-independent protein secretion pathway component TatC
VITAAILTPPDIVSQLTLVVVMVIICGVLLFIVSRFKALAQTPKSIKYLILALVCLLSMTITSSMMFLQGSHQSNKSYRQLEIEHAKCLASQEQTQIQSQ